MEIRKNFDDMKLMPTDYIAYLLSNEVGFAQSERLNYSGKGNTGIFCVLGELSSLGMYY